MRTDNKVCAHVFSPNREKQIKECDLLIVFGFSEEDDGMELQTLILGGDINATKTVSALGHRVATVVESFAEDRIHALLLTKLLCAAIRDEMEESSGEKEFVKKFFEAKIK